MFVDTGDGEPARSSNRAHGDEVHEQSRSTFNETALNGKADVYSIVYV